MKFLYCNSPHNPPHSYGDCIGACLATMLQDAKFPHFHDGRDPVESWVALREYMRQTHGKKLALFYYEDDSGAGLDAVLKYMGINNPDIYYMLLCKTPVGDHAIVCKGDEVIHDPAGYSKITGPHSNGQWIIGIINA